MIELYTEKCLKNTWGPYTHRTTKNESETDKC